MTHDLIAPRPKPLSTTEARSDRALKAMLDNLEDLNRWVREIDDERAEARQSRGNLRVSIEAMLRSAPFEVSRRHEARYLRLNARPDVRPRQLKGAMGEVIRYLVENDFPTVRGADLAYYLKRIGVEVNKRYTGKALQSLVGEGMLRRIRHGVYAINHSHPELVALRIQKIERKKQELRDWERRAVGPVRADEKLKVNLARNWSIPEDGQPCEHSKKE